MKITPDQALESVQSIFKSLDWEIELKTDPPAILTGFHIDKTRDAIVAIALDDERRSIIIGCSFAFEGCQLCGIGEAGHGEGWGISPPNADNAPRTKVRKIAGDLICKDENHRFL